MIKRVFLNATLEYKRYKAWSVVAWNLKIDDTLKATTTNPSHFFSGFYTGQGLFWNITWTVEQYLSAGLVALDY